MVYMFSFDVIVDVTLLMSTVYSKLFIVGLLPYTDTLVFAVTFWRHIFFDVFLLLNYE